jgi:hypothetical protein
MEELYLIVHLVRGEPALDIAIKLQIGDEEGWLIPTSGHRAYPYYTWPMSDLYDGSDMDMPAPLDILDNVDPPEGHPDHYQATAAKGRGLVSNLVSLLSLIPKGRINRR